MDAIDKETAWRKQELTTVKLQVQASRQVKRPVALRSAVPILYAHWEGWIKATSKLYVEFVNEQHLRYEQLSPSFLGAALKVKLSSVDASQKAAVHTDFANFIASGGMSTTAVVSPDLVRTESNLSSVVLRDIVCRLGLDFTVYESKALLIDQRLLHQRNTIAHGSHLRIDEVSYLALHDEVVAMLRAFATDITNAAATKAYMRSTPTTPARATP